MARCGKKRGRQAFSGRHPYSAPFREMATCGLALEENRDFHRFDPVVARCGQKGTGGSGENREKGLPSLLYFLLFDDSLGSGRNPLFSVSATDWTRQKRE